MQAESKNKFICALPRRSLSSGPNRAKEAQPVFVHNRGKEDASNKSKSP